MCDVDLISLAVTSESLGIDSENLLFSKIKTDYPEQFPNLIHRARYNARRKNLVHWIVYCAQIWSEKMDASNQDYIVDSIPIPECKICREKRSTVCRKSGDAVQATKGVDSTIRQYFIGYRLHLIVSDTDLYQHHELLPANVHDINFLKHLEYTPLTDCTLIGDLAYRSQPLQLQLFADWGIKLSAPFRSNQHAFEPYPYERKIQRKRIETQFSQYCDDLMLKRNYAKSYDGLSTRIATKIASMTLKQYWNYLNGNEIGKTKHSFAA